MVGLVLFGGMLVLMLLGIPIVFAIGLARTQTKARSDLQARVHERAVLAAASRRSAASS